MEQFRLAGLDREVAGDRPQERQQCFHMGGSLLVYLLVCDGDVVISESLQYRVPRRKLRLLAESVPSLQTHSAVIGTTARAGNQIPRFPLRDVFLQPTSKTVCVQRRRVELVHLCTQQHRHRSDAIR